MIGHHGAEAVPGRRQLHGLTVAGKMLGFRIEHDVVTDAVAPGKTDGPLGMPSAPPGPASPVLAMATWAGLSRRAPAAISRATSSLVRLCRSMVSGLTPSRRCLASGE